MSKEITLSTPAALNGSIKEIDAALAAGLNKLTVDLAASTFISVEGLEWLEELLVRAKSYSTEVSLVNVCPEIYKVFKVARVDNILNVVSGVKVSGPVC